MLSKTSMNPYRKRTRLYFERLTQEQQAYLERGFERHRRACEHLGVAIENSWVDEAIADMMIDIKLSHG